MTESDDHFLETFDRKLGGGATRDELAALDEHARRCRSCALQLALAGGSYAYGRHTATDRLLDGQAIQAAVVKLGLDRRPKRPSVWVLAAAAVLLAGAAGASSAWLEFGAGRASVSAPVVTESAASAPGKVDRSVSVESPSEPALESPKPPGAAAGDSVQKSLGPSVESTLAPAIETPAALFAKANQLRRQGKDQQAIEIYHRLQQRYSGSLEARQSFATMGWLFLDRSRANEALAQFDRYLKEGGPGSEDALGGRALALQRLGRTTEERRTLETLIAQHPRSANAARARVRLLELH